ncbi:MAG: hypothetical protein OEM63_07460 [Gammaproteobacteria bacterium]|nr:hypothetical protein [Gammaproteobacteria bacterium]
MNELINLGKIPGFPVLSYSTREQSLLPVSKLALCRAILLLTCLLAADYVRAECTPDQTFEIVNGEVDDIDGVVGITEAGTIVTCTGAEPRQVTTTFDPDIIMPGPPSVTVNIEPGATLAGPFIPVLLTGVGNTINNLGTVSVIGDELFSLAIAASGGTIDNMGSISAIGADTGGMGIQGDSATLLNGGNIIVNGFDNSGMELQGNSGQATNSGTLTMNGGNAIGISAVGDGAVLMNPGVININGGSAIGMAALGTGAVVNNSNTIETDAVLALGMGAVGENVNVTNAAGATVETKQDQSIGMFIGLQSVPPVGLPAQAADPAQGTLTNQGRVITTMSGADAIHAFATNSTIVNEGTLETQGSQANGMNVVGSEVSATNKGTIMIGGDSAVGIRGDGSDLRLNNGTAADRSAQILASGAQRMRGMELVSGDGSTIQNFGTITINADRTPRVPGDGERLATFSHGVVLGGGGGGIEIVDGNQLINDGTIEVLNERMPGSSVLIDSFGAMVRNDSNGVLLSGVAFADGASGTISNFGLIDGGIADRFSLTRPSTGTGASGATIFNASTGIISGGDYAISMLAGKLTLSNNGAISAENDVEDSVVELAGKNVTVQNRGSITGSQQKNGLFITEVSTGTSVLVNSGSIRAGSGVGSRVEGGTSALGNQGTIVATAVDGVGVNMLSEDAAATFVNEGVVEATGERGRGVVMTSFGADQRATSLENRSSGIIRTGESGGIAVTFIAAANGKVVNEGQILTQAAGAHGISVSQPGSNFARVVNRGSIEVSGQDAVGVFAPDSLSGEINLGLINEEGATIRSAGVAVRGGSGADRVTNSGLVDGDINLGQGADWFIITQTADMAGKVDGGFDDDNDILFADFSATGVLDGSMYSRFDEFIKQGDGALLLSNRLFISEATRVNGKKHTSVQEGSLILLEGSTLVSDVSVNSGARIGGANGTVQGNISGPGIIAPGLSPGRLDVIGDVFLDGTLEIELAGLETGLFDQLVVDGDMTIDGGILDILLLDDFAPQVGDTFEFLTVTGDVSGLDTLQIMITTPVAGIDFDLSLMALTGGGFRFDLVTLVADLDTSEIPIPAAVWLFGTALIGLVGFSKRRKTA